MSSKTEINYLGDDNYLRHSEVKKIALEVIKKYWKLPGLSPEDFKIDINIVSDVEIQEVNQKYLNRNRPTDVIAFSLQEGEQVPEEGPPLIGQIIISKDTAQRQAVEYKHSIKEEMIILLIHGLLHVAGWDEGEEIQKCQETIKDQLQVLT